MNELLKYFLESSIIFAVFYAVYYFWLINDKNYRFSRFYLLTSSVLAIILPLLQIPVIITGTFGNIFTIQETVQLPEVIITAETGLSANNGLKISWLNILFVVYVIGVTYLLSRIIIENIYLIGFILKNRAKIINHGNYKLIHTGGKIPTSTWFNFIFWNEAEELNLKEKEQILRHEEAHILKKHSLDVLYIEILRTVFWPNPFIHGYKLAIISLHEWQADDYVVQQSNVSDYIRLLANQVFRSFNLQMSNHFSKSKTVRRINMIKSGKRKSIYTKTILSLTITLFLFYIFSCNMVDQAGINDYTDESTVLITESQNNPQDLSAGQPEPGEEIFTMVEDQPIPQGGMEEFYRYVQENMIYPESAKTAGIEGKVFVEFVVGKDGSIKNVKVLKGIDPACDKAAKDILENSPDWIPGYQKGSAVDVRMIMPIMFKLSDKKTNDMNNMTEKK